MSKKIIVIPARMDSERLPGKPMLEIAGKPLVWWTCQQASRTEADYVIVATPDREIGEYCQQQGFPWRPTREDHPTGTHRVAEVVEQMKIDLTDNDVVVNWQADEPLIEIKDANRLMNAAIENREIKTLVAPIIAADVLINPSMTKAAVSEDGRVQWFSRAALRGSMVHCGIYAFFPEMLSILAAEQPTQLSIAESLEQLAWMESGHFIRTIRIDECPLSINTQADLNEFRMMKGGTP